MLVMYIVHVQYKLILGECHLFYKSNKDNHVLNGDG